MKTLDVNFQNPLFAEDSQLYILCPLCLDRTFGGQKVNECNMVARCNRCKKYFKVKLEDGYSICSECSGSGGEDKNHWCEKCSGSGVLDWISYVRN